MKLCAACDAELTAAGLCPICDRPPTSSTPHGGWTNLVLLDAEATVLLAGADRELRDAA